MQGRLIPIAVFIAAVAVAAASCGSRSLGETDCSSYKDGPTVGPGAPGPTGFPEEGCDPSTDRSRDRDSYYRCCSDDPDAAGAANDQSESGMCVHVADIPPGSGLAPLNCPIACDPTEDETATAERCGANRLCCQTRELQPEDCIEDDQTGMWRPLTPEEAGYKLATQRGYCLALTPGQACPTTQASYMTACDRINAGTVDPPEG